MFELRHTKVSTGLILFLVMLFPILPSSLSFSQEIKGIYVDGFAAILGNQEKEDSLLHFAQNNGFNYLTLYEMHIVNSNSPISDYAQAQPFADFISKAKNHYGILEIGVAGENYNSFYNAVHPYNLQHPADSQKVDVFNLEFEYWNTPAVSPNGYYCDTYLSGNGLTCDTAGAFIYYLSTLKKIDSLAAITNAKSECYLGWFNEGHGAQIASSGVDRILVHIYITSANYSPSFQYNYIDTRLENLASAETFVDVMPIYSSETEFMYDYAVNNDFFAPFSDLQTTLNGGTDPWKNFINLKGIQWFAYTDLPKKNMNLGVSDISLHHFNFYPNPTSESIVIYGIQEEDVKISVLSLDGKKIIEIYSAGNKELLIDISKLKNGCYLVEYQSKNGTKRESFIKN